VIPPRHSTSLAVTKELGLLLALPFSYCCQYSRRLLSLLKKRISVIHAPVNSKPR